MVDERGRYLNLPSGSFRQITELLDGHFGSEVLELHERTWERRSKKGSAGSVPSSGGR